MVQLSTLSNGLSSDSMRWDSMVPLRTKWSALSLGPLQSYPDEDALGVVLE